MSKQIKFTVEQIQKIREEFETVLSQNASNGEISYLAKLDKVDHKARLLFTPVAWAKMLALIDGFTTEVAWHGTVERGENDDYIVSDILMYPQKVTGATVDTDQNEYQSWLFGHENDVFNNIRFQGHSHVRMGTTPSGVDERLYDSLLSQLDNTMFYVFGIWNKLGEHTVKIYDIAKNILFENADITVTVLLDGNETTEQYVKKAEAMVTPAVSSVAYDCKDHLTVCDRTATPLSYYGRGYGDWDDDVWDDIGYGRSSNITSIQKSADSTKGRVGKRKK